MRNVFIFITTKKGNNMDKGKRAALILELMSVIRKHDTHSKSEVYYKDIMPTTRRFRADFYVPKYLLLIEVNGGQWNLGRHNRGGIGYENDMIKINLANINGFKVLQYTYEMLQRGELIKDLDYLNRNELDKLF